MFGIIKRISLKFLIPSAGNGYRPRILEGQFFYIFVTLLVGIKLLSFISFQEFLKAEIFSNIVQDDIVALTNAARQGQGLPELITSPTLKKVADLKLADMLQKNYFSHTSPEGKTPWYWFDKAGYNYKLAGENLAMDFFMSKDVVNAWMNSESHKRNILFKDFKEIGVAVGKGKINGHETVAIVEVFGSPIEKKTIVSKLVGVANASSGKTPAPSVSPVSTQSTPVKLKEAPISLAKEIAQTLVNVRGDISERAPEVVNRTSNWALNLLAIAAIMILILKVFVAFRIQFPVLIFRAVILVVVSFWMVWSGPNMLNKQGIIITDIAEFINTEIR